MKWLGPIARLRSSRLLLTWSTMSANDPLLHARLEVAAGGDAVSAFDDAEVRGRLMDAITIDDFVDYRAAFSYTSGICRALDVDWKELPSKLPGVPDPGRPVSSDIPYGTASRVRGRHQRPYRDARHEYHVWVRRTTNRAGTRRWRPRRRRDSVGHERHGRLRPRTPACAVWQPNVICVPAAAKTLFRAYTHPADAVRVLQRAAEAEIEIKKRPAYRSAAALLVEARSCAIRSGDEASFDTYVRRLRVDHRQKHALQDELNRAQLTK